METLNILMKGKGYGVFKNTNNEHCTIISYYMGNNKKIKNMKKITLALILVIAFITFSCDKNIYYNKPIPEEILGEWVVKDVYLVNYPLNFYYYNKKTYCGYFYRKQHNTDLSIMLQINNIPTSNFFFREATDQYYNIIINSNNFRYNSSVYYDYDTNRLNNDMGIIITILSLSKNNLSIKYFNPTEESTIIYKLIKTQYIKYE